jgi:hypothetical protein
MAQFGPALLPLKRGMIHSDTDRAAARTYHGQAHFAEGPETCRACRFFVRRPDKKIGYFCQRYLELMNKWGREIPANASSCRHFERKPERSASRLPYTRDPTA